MEKYQFEGEEVERVVESMSGDYWVITDDSGAHPFGYACLSSMRQFAEWGTINRDNITGSMVWDVPRENWSFTGPDGYIDIEKVDD